MKEDIVLSEAARKSRNEYQKKWRKENPIRAKEHQAKYWERVAQREATEEEREGKA